MKFTFIAFLVLAAPLARAAGEPADYVQVPQVVAGEREIDFKAGSATPADGGRISAASVGFGYGINDVWFSEAYAKWQRVAPEQTRFDAIELENKLQLTETGQYPVDLGLVLETEFPRARADGYPVTLTLLMQAESGRWQFNGNVLLQRSYRGEAADVTQFGYQWQVQYRWQPALQYGLQGFGELGPWNAWSSRSGQTNRAGPALFGKLSLGHATAIRYNAAWLVGMDPGAPAHTLRLQSEYEF